MTVNRVEEAEKIRKLLENMDKKMRKAMERK